MTVDVTPNTNPSLNQPYKYQWIELERHFGLEQYETINRTIDPQLGLITQIDSKAEKHYDMSPCASMGDNPVRNVDPNGNDWWATVDFAIAHPLIANDVGEGNYLKRSV